MAKLASIQSVPVNSKPESTSVSPESVTFTTVIQEQVVSTTVITQSMKFTLGISESAESTSVFPESTECTLITQESVKSNVVPQSIRSVPDLSQSAGPIPVSAEMTRITASLPVLAEVATDTTEAVKHAVSIHQKRRKAHAVQSNALPVMSTKARLMSLALSTECIPACHVMSMEALPMLAACPVMATEADAEFFVLPVLATEANSKPPAFPVASTDAIPASHVKSKNISVSQVLSTEVIPEQPTLTVLATKAIPEALIQPVMVKEAISEFPAVPVVPPEAVPERPTLNVLAMEAIPEALIQTVMATEATSVHPILPVTAMEAIPKQPVVTAAEAFSESLASLLRATREILATLTVATRYEIPEGEPPESAREEVASKSAPKEQFPSPLQRELFKSPLPLQREQSLSLP